jgi:hypothetical protein|tara:strand:- start:154 stop:456 length:303 start_codon:yes stop_codon:yes gene_type:complete
MDVAGLISDFGFPVVAVVGLGYFIYYVWKYINTEIKPALGEMHMQLIRVIDQFRMLDQDLIRLQQKVNVVLEYRERQAVLEDAKEKEALKQIEEQEIDNK